MKLIDLSAGFKVARDKYLSLHSDVTFTSFFVSITCSGAQFVFFISFYILLEFIFNSVLIKSFYGYHTNRSLMANIHTLVILLVHSSF